jgi:hypothetical protein
MAIEGNWDFSIRKEGATSPTGSATYRSGYKGLTITTVVTENLFTSEEQVAQYVINLIKQLQKRASLESSTPSLKEFTQQGNEIECTEKFSAQASLSRKVCYIEGGKKYGAKSYAFKGKSWLQKVKYYPFTHLKVKKHTKEWDKEAHRLLNVGKTITHSSETLTRDDVLRDYIKMPGANVEAAQRYMQERECWLNSNYFRHLLRRSSSFEKAIESYIAAPINMRHHTVNIGDGNPWSFYRVGIISDMSNGFTNLKELKALRGDEKLRGEKVEEVEKEKAKNKKQKQSLKYALKELGSQVAITAAIKKRKKILASQFLLLLSAQIEKNPSLIDGGEFNLAHVALLNPQKHDFDKSGWMHDEENEALDMAEIFEEFNGVKISFESARSKTPRYDEDVRGKITTVYLPKPSGIKDGECTLRTFFSNICVQSVSGSNFYKKSIFCDGESDNTGAQKNINDKTLTRLGGVFSNINGRLNTNAGKGTSTYAVAEELCTKMLERGNIALSFGCLSAKDRTGFVAGRIAVKKRLGSSDNKELEQELSMDILRKGCAVQCVYDNTRSKNGLSVSPLKVPGSASISSRIRYIPKVDKLRSKLPFTSPIYKP